MKSIFQNFLRNTKNYFILPSLLIISIFLITLNSKPEVKKIKALCFGSFALFNSALSEAIDLFNNDSELNELRRLNAELMLQNALLKKQTLQVKQLKNMLEFKDTTNYPLTAAEVISKFGSVFSGQMLINVGRKDSINIGMPVITEKGLVGIVSNISDDFAVVKHIKNSDFSVAVTVLPSNIEGVLNWDGDQLKINNIPTTAKIGEGDVIFTSDFSTIVPPQIPVGKVSRFESSVAGMLSDVVVQPFTPIESVTTVFIIRLKKIDIFSGITE